MSYYDNQYTSLKEAWGRVPNYSQYSFYQSDKNDYGQTFTNLERDGPQLDRKFRRKYDTEREYDADIQYPSRRYTIETGEVKPRPPLRKTIPKSSGVPDIVQKIDEYRTKINYGPNSYPNTYITEYFGNLMPTNDKQMVKFYNRAILVLLIGFLVKFILDKLGK